MFRKAPIIILLIGILAIWLPACSGKLSLAEQEVAELKLEIAELQEDIEMQEKECSENKIEKILDMNKMKDIIKYNFVDCKLLLDLLNFVRNYIFKK